MKFKIIIILAFIAIVGFLPNHVNSKLIGTFLSSGPEIYTIKIHNALNQVVIYANGEIVYSKSNNNDKPLNDTVSITIIPGKNVIQILCIKWAAAWHLNYEISTTGMTKFESPVNDAGRNSQFGLVTSHEYIINRW